MGTLHHPAYVRRMTSLHIEHAITDLDTWTTAFVALADVRRQAGVRAEQVRTPVGDSKYVVIDLEFDSTVEATSFLAFLRSVVWSTPDASPALAGTPETKLLEPVTLT